MARLNVTFSAAVVLSAAVVCPSQALAQQRSQDLRQPVAQTAGATLAGGITGTVTDERGAALSGAMVSVLGATMAMDVTDAQGRFALARLPAGEYVLRVHLQGFAASPREIIRIAGASLSAYYRIQLHRLNSPAATSDTLASRPILAAGFNLPSVEDGDGATASNAADKDDHPHGETAWRLRHLPRSILKDASNAVVVTQDDAPAPESYLSKAGTHSGVAASLFDSLPFSGEINLLTTGAYAPGSFLSGDRLPRSVAYFAVGAPAGPGKWNVRAAMSEGALSSWLVAGSFASTLGATHAYSVGLSYSAQDFQGGNPLSLAAVFDGSRNVGEIYGVDRWTVAPGVTLEYGGSFARYDYLLDRDFFSPHAGLTLAPTRATRVTAAFTQRMVAPGAEEFLSPGTLGPWLPPERTFAPLQGHDLRVERARTLDFAVEHEFGASYVVGIRRFFDSVDDQLVTLFGLNVPGAPHSVGHFYVANGGDVDAEGWALRVSSPAGKRLRSTVDYSLTRARWADRYKADALHTWAPAAIRPETESVQDITTTLQTDIPETATRVFLLYKVNTGFTRSDLSLQHAGLDARFDLQVNQALPFGLAGTQWEVLIGLRNLFRDPTDPASIYDELLVVRPPKRVVGGFLVKF